ncbi:hypothetical protein B0H11DRAFT_2217820 [Mycena galericulata]|nr:hypothetical protein B0H11DRAFT_2244270 [Mycena galericulata]KAJ7508535.1 hypothetical protein B0H11DRAFT_2217820 [Mycena galericulata]
MPELPLELERQIFELAVRSDPKNAYLKLKLSLVARRFSVWVDVVFYEFVTILSKRGANRFMELVPSKPPGFFAATVKALCLTYSVPAAQAFDVLSECSGLHRLACWIDHSKSPELDFPLLVSQFSLTELSIELEHFLNLPDSSACFSDLTHVHLTHVALALGTDHLTEAFKAVFTGCPSVQVFMITYSDNSSERREQLAKDCSFDVRTVVADRATVTPIADWENVNLSQENMWTYAEGIIALRKAPAARAAA